mgnify:FL=1
MAEEAAEEAKEESAEEAPAEENKAEATETPEAKTTKEKPKVDEDLPLSVEEMFGIRLQPAFIERLSDKGKAWLAKAMVNMLIADKVIDQSEMCYLEDALSLVDSDEERAALMETAKKREVTPMENLNTDRMYAGHFFYYLAMIVAADGKVKTSEVNYLMKICGKLGFPPRSAKDVLRWATDLVKLNKERGQMVDGFRHVSPVFAES